MNEQLKPIILITGGVLLLIILIIIIILLIKKHKLEKKKAYSLPPSTANATLFGIETTNKNLKPKDDLEKTQILNLSDIE